MQVYYQLLPKYRCDNFAFVSTSKPVQAYYSSDRYSKKVNEVPPQEISGEPETARDLLQDGFIKVFTKIQTYSATGPFGAWVRRIFVTTALEYLRKYDALRLSAPIDEYGEQVEDTDASVLDRLSADDLLECISRLPNGYRTVFNLYAIEGYTHKEIAAMLNIQEITSRSQFTRARKALQEMVQSLITQDDVSRNRT